MSKNIRQFNGTPSSKTFIQIKFFDQLSDYEFFKKDSAPWI
jgi:hypothetical protein